VLDHRDVMKALASNGAARDQVWKDLEEHSDRIQDLYGKILSDEYKLDEHDKSLTSLILSLILCEISAKVIRYAIEDNII